jgi:O-6-methylguanine DNA methyltransferase
MKAVKEALNNVRYAPVSTPFGQLYVAYRGRTICHAMVAPTDDAFERACVKRLGARPMRDARPPGEMADQVVDHLTRRRRFQGRLDLNGLTPFQRLVLEKTREIPYGEVRSYQWVAREIGAKRAVRAVGTALAKNPIPFLIPCHRVVRTDGQIGHYSAGGSTMKSKVLAFEGVDVEGLARLAGRRIRFVGNDATRIFCLPTCEAARRAHKSQAVYLITQRDAARRGYRPCQHCRPV